MMTRKIFLIGPLGVLLSGCGGGGNGTFQAPQLSLTGRNRDGLHISFSQSSDAIALGQSQTFTVTLKNDTSKSERYYAFQDAQGTFPADLLVRDEAGREVFLPDFEKITLIDIDLKPNQSLTRTMTVPATVLASKGTYRAQASFTNGYVLGDGASDVLGPLKFRVR